MAELLTPSDLPTMPFSAVQESAAHKLLTTISSLNHLTRITLYSGYPLGQDFKHVLDLTSVNSVDNWLLNKAHRLDEFMGTYQRRDEKIRYPGNYDKIKTANYVRVENYYGESNRDKLIWYGFVTNVTYVNERTTFIDWTVDSWMTFNSQRSLNFVGDTFVERSHTDDFKNVDDGKIELANINPENQSVTTALQTADIYDLNFGGSWSDTINFAIYWLMPNFGDTSPSQNLPNGSYSFNGAPSMLQPFVFAYDSKTNMTVKLTINSSVGSYSTHGGSPVNILIAHLATDPDVVGHRNFVAANATEYFGVAWKYDKGKDEVIIDKWDSPSGNLQFKEYVPAGQLDSMLYFSELVNTQMIEADLKLSAYQMSRAAQLQTLKQEGQQGYQIRNVKTSLTPYVSFDLTDGFGGDYTYNTSYINYENPNLSVKVVRMGGAGYGNKVHTAINRYMDLSSEDETAKFKAMKIIKHGILQTEDKQLPIVSDTYTSTNAVNVNSNKMIYKNAENSRRNNHLQNATTIKNMNTGLDAQTAQLKNSQSTARKTMDMKTGANLVEGAADALGFDVDRNGANAITGAISGAIGGLGGGAIGIGMGAAGGAYSGYNATQIQNTQQSSDRRNQRIGQAATRQTTKNSVETSELIANNNYENAIENFQAKQSDLALAGDNLVQMGGDVFFSYSNNLNLTKLVISTETADRIIQVDSYFTMFGYNVNKLFNSSAFNMLIHSRTRFNYVRTTGIRIVADNMPEKDKQAIEMIFDSGVTIWHDTDNYLNYQLINHQVSLGDTRGLLGTALYHNQLMQDDEQKAMFMDFIKTREHALTDNQLTVID